MSYEDPLVSRYASEEMVGLFTAESKFTTWRRLWLALAESQAELGLDISEAQLAELRRNLEDIDFEAVAAEEQRTRHDVMAHLRVYARQCPSAGAMLHLGATSAFVGDNTELVQLRDALNLIRQRLVGVIRALAVFARRTRALPTLGYTHLQPAQLTTVGKRATIWLQDFLLDAEALDFERSRLRLRGVKGTTGTQASFLALFDGDHDKVDELERLVAAKLGFTGCYPVTGQTYPRKVDAALLAVLGGIAISAAKFATDLRLLMALGQLEEPIGRDQIGSSAMAYKRNPVRTERMVALSRWVIAGFGVAAANASSQWLERTLDDSANRRLLLPQASLASEAILILARSVADGLVVHERVIARTVASEIPYQATETILMEAVKRGGDRQELHERLRQLSFEVRRREREEGAPNDLLERIAADASFGVKLEELNALCEPARFIGRAPQQVDRFLGEQVEPWLAGQPEDEGSPDLRV